MRTTTDVLIIGGGPTGLALARDLARDLARRGIDHRVLDRAPGPSTASRAKTVQPRTLEVLDDLGVVDRLLAQGAVHVPTRHYDRDQVRSEALEAAIGMAAPGVPYAPLWLSQPLVEQALRDRLAEDGGQVGWATEVTGLVRYDDAVEVTAGGEVIRARYVVGADGGRGTVRRQVGVGMRGDSYATHRWWLGDVRITGLDRTCQHLWMSPEHGILSIFPLPSTDLWQFQASVPADDADPVQPNLALFRDLLAAHAGLPGVTVDDADWLSLYKINVCLADRYRVDRVFLAGDAAHIHSPAGGQGMNTGIQDSYNLGWKLAAVLAGADAALLDTYEAERRPVARAVLDDSTARLHTVMDAATQGDGSAAQRGLTGDFTTGLTIAYPDSPITGSGSDGDLVRPGDRAPDAGLAAAGGPVRIFDLLRGPHWTVLTFGDADPAPAPAGTPVYRIDRSATGSDTLIDTTGDAHRTYGVEAPTSMLIRPDGYLATRTTHAADAAAATSSSTR
ncbi:MAG TPA: FAD-dependent monooxygenase [Pseudonocardiaceae bacterium]|nr:FAD-dependent monooxygenase [Pseudonocardiaceae bacterium]